MTIDSTLRRIDTYGQQIEAQVEKLSKLPPPPLQTVEQVGPKANSEQVLMSVFVDQLAGAAAFLKAVHDPVETNPLPPTAGGKTSDRVIDVTDYKEVPGDS